MQYGKCHVYNRTGRMHDACISGIDTDKRFVSVEWIEGKDTKGKEVRTYSSTFKSP